MSGSQPPERPKKHSTKREEGKLINVPVDDSQFLVFWGFLFVCFL